jgi:hypothetical protein
LDSIIINHEESYLLNKLDDYPVTKGEGKFDNDGNPLHWPGCTIICPIQESSLVSSLLSEVQENFKKIAPKKKYTFLPQSSFHMTLFDCCNVSTFKTTFWPNNIQETENYLEVANILSDRLKNYQFPNSLAVKLNKFFGGFSTLLTPYSSKDEEILRNCRDDLSNLLSIKFENHLRYTFHITLAYILEPLTLEEISRLIGLEKKMNKKFKNEIPLINLPQPEICVFNDMYKFTNINNLIKT